MRETRYRLVETGGKWLVQLVIVAPDGKETDGAALFFDKEGDVVKFMLYLCEHGEEIKRDALAQGKGERR